MPAHQFFGQNQTLRVGRSGWNHARIRCEQVSPGWQNIFSAPIGRPGWTGRHPLAIKGGEKRRAFGFDRGVAIKFWSNLGCAPENMQSITKLAFLNVAHKAVDAADRLCV